MTNQTPASTIMGPGEGSDLRIGQTVNSYSIAKKIGEGGMGTVYLAEHKIIGKKAAVKFLLPSLCAMTEIVDRFVNEARMTSMVTHPGVVDIYDFGVAADGSAFIIMELLEGEPLADLLEREEVLSDLAAAEIGMQVASALQAAHHADIIHRDLKPENVFLVPDSAVPGQLRPKILDFGIAKMDSDLAGRQTRTGQIIGSPSFMSPEQCTGAGLVDSRTDIYSLGCVLYAMICGRPPFVEQGAGALLSAHITKTPENMRVFAPQVDAELESIVMSTLAKDPNGRPATAQILAAMLEQVSVRLAAELGGRDTGVRRRAVGTRPPSLPQAATPAPLQTYVSQPTTGSRYAPTQQAAYLPSPGPAVSGPVSGVISSAAILPGPRHTGAKVLAALGLLIAVGGAVAAWSGDGESSPALAAESPPKEKKVGAKARDGLRERPSQEKDFAEVTSTPVGAEVFDEESGELLGTTPLRIDDRSFPVFLRIEGKGYAAKSLQLHKGDRRTILLLVEEGRDSLISKDEDASADDRPEDGDSRERRRAERRAAAKKRRRDERAQKRREREAKKREGSAPPLRPPQRAGNPKPKGDWGQLAP